MKTKNTTLCLDDSTPIVTTVQTPPDVGRKTMGEVTTITGDDKPRSTNRLRWSHTTIQTELLELEKGTEEVNPLGTEISWQLIIPSKLKGPRFP